MEIESIKKYALDYQFNILYCQNPLTSNVCRILDPAKGQFIATTNSEDLWKSSYKIDEADIAVLTKIIYNDKIGLEPNKSDLEWLIAYDKEYYNSPSILSNSDITYNMFLLKLQLIGFPLEFAEDFILNYYKLQHNGLAKVTLNELYRKICYMIAAKDFWVLKDMKQDLSLEVHFISELLKKKQEVTYQFSFDTMFRKDYMKLIEKSFIPKLIKYNLKESYLVQNPIEFKYQIPYLLSVYRTMILQIIEEVSLKYPVDRIFLDNLPMELESCVKDYLDCYER